MTILKDNYTEWESYNRQIDSQYSRGIYFGDWSWKQFCKT